MNKTQLEQMGACAVNAAKTLQTATAQQKNIFFEEAIKLIQKNTNEILDANLQDINDAHSKNKDDAFIDRLRLDNARIDGICDALNEIQLAIQLLSENVGVLTTNQQSTNKSLYNIR